MTIKAKCVNLCLNNPDKPCADFQIDGSPQTIQIIVSLPDLMALKLNTMYTVTVTEAK